MSEQQQPGQPHGTPPVPPRYQGQHFPGPQYPQSQQYAQGKPYTAGQPYAAAPYPNPQFPDQPRSGGSLGRVAFIIALVSLGIGLLVTLTFPLLIRGVEYSSSMIGAVSGVGNGLVLVTAIVALIIGLIAVRRPGQQIFAGIAIGIAGSEVIGILVSWGSNLVLNLQYL